jgi:Protein of unknown function (DUF3685)
MIKYWPEKQGINLNNEVVNLFRYAYSKLDTNLHNNTSWILSIDIINIKVKRQLFKAILYELEVLVLDIIELNLTLEELQTLTKKITIDLIKKSIDNFYLLTQVQSSNLSQSHKLERFCDFNLFIDNLLIYLIFGSNTLNSNKTLFSEVNVPTKYIEILLDNLVVQVSNIVFLHCITHQLSLSSLLVFLISNNLCNDTYISIKSLATFRNNLNWQDLIDYYLIQPKIVYNNRYKVWLLTPEGLSCKYIYACRENDFFKLSNLQLIIIVLLELQDFLFPKINNIVFNLSKVLIYTWGYFFNQFFKLLLKSVFFVFRTKKQ